MVSKFTLRPGALAYTANGLAEEYYTLLRRKYQYAPGAAEYEPGADVPIHHRYEAFLERYAHLPPAQIILRGFGGLGLSRDELVRGDIIVPPSRAFKQRVNQIDEAMDAWAREEGIMRLTTYLKDLLDRGKALFKINRKIGGHVSKARDCEYSLFYADFIPICVNGLVARVQTYVGALEGENTILSDIPALRRDRGGAEPGALPVPPSDRVRGICQICGDENNGYTICTIPEHFICEECLPDAIAHHRFRGTGFQTYKCLYCLNTPTPNFLALMHQPEFAALSRFKKSDPEWLPDRVVKNCTKCHAPFTLFNRRHHCRRCGLIICQACSEGTKEARVCKGGC